jgi:LmbE family N-acetylglucosaminyl deacetylase
VEGILTSFRSRLRPIKRATARVVERCWSLGFSAAGGLARQQTRRWASPGDQRILIVAPHPDDEAVGCAGTILRHVQAGDSVCLAVATDGRQSGAMVDPQEMSSQRKREALHAAELMQIDRLEWIGVAEGAWEVTVLQDRLSALIGEVEPDIIYAPSRIDFHPEHLLVAHALALALGEVSEPRRQGTRLRIYPIQVPLGPSVVNLVTDVSAVQPQCEAVLGAYVSQAASVHCARRRRRYSASFHRIGGHAEELWDLPAAHYVALHRGSPVQWPKVFRGLRNFPLTDPLAYLAGTGERRKIGCDPTARPMTDEP